MGCMKVFVQGRVAAGHVLYNDEAPALPAVDSSGV